MHGLFSGLRICWVLLLAAVMAHEAWAQITPESVLVLYDQQSADGLAIAQHYASVHPGVNLLPLDLSGLSSQGEEITPGDYLNVIRPQVLGGLNPQVDVIVTTSGMPLRINAGPNPDQQQFPFWGQYSSLESELARIDEIDTADEMTDQNWSPALFGIPDVLPANPYYQGLDGFGNPYTGPQGFDRSDPTNEGIRLTSRLDGFDVNHVIDAIDRAQNVHLVQLPAGPTFVLDDDPLNASNPGATPSEDRMEVLRDDILTPTNLPFVYDGTDQELGSAAAPVAAPVMGFISFGTNDDPPAGSGFEPGYVTDQLTFTPANGAVFHTYESFNAVSFDPAQRLNGQALVGDWLQIGGTAALGHVQEPTASISTITNEDILFDMLINGFTFVEAAWAATQQLSFVNTVIGDPLMTWQLVLTGDANLNGTVDGTDVIAVQQNFGNVANSPDGFSYLVGDANFDSIVDGTDLIAVQQSFGQIAALIHLLLGDANNDGVVDGTDLIAVQQNFGDTGLINGSLLGDANDDGQVNGDDLIAIQQAFGNTLASAPLGLEAPEPTSLLLNGGLMLLLMKKRRSSR